MPNAPAHKLRAAASIPANNPLLVAPRRAYSEVWLGLPPSYEFPRQAHAINYERTRLACVEVKAKLGYLPAWKRDTKVPAWLIAALSQVKADFGDYY